MEYEKSYVFEPEQARPSKRRKVEPQGLQASWKIRRAAYREAWDAQQRKIDEKLNKINASTVSELSNFLDENLWTPTDGKIPTGLISTGPDAASQLPLIDRLSRSASDKGRRLFVSLPAGQATNLKATLKIIIQKATAEEQNVNEDDDDDLVSRKGRKLLNYDLQILADYVRDRNVKQVVLAIQDTEAFESHLLSELIELFGYWCDRIPFVLLLNIATSLNFLQQRLPRSAVGCLRGQLFDVAPAQEEVEQVFDAVIDQENSLWIGPNIMRFALERQSDYVQSTDGFVNAIRYAYMSCYYANALSIFLDPALDLQAAPADHFEAIRVLPSFKAYCQQLLQDNRAKELRGLLDNDTALHGKIVQKISESRYGLRGIIDAIHVVKEIQLVLLKQDASSKPTLYIQAMSNKLADSSLIRTLLLSIRKASSDTVFKLLDAILKFHLQDGTHKKCTDIHNQLSALVKEQTDTTNPLRSGDDIKNSTLRTTVVAQKVELSKQKSTLSKQDAVYTELLCSLSSTLEDYFRRRLIDPTSLPFHEIFMYDLRSPHREVFTPRPRHAIERALAAPHDYLACDCCTPSEGDGDEATLASSQPAAAVLYQLYLESGSLVNVHDLWQAFQAVTDGERLEEQRSIALFMRALAELRYLGLVKGTRKKVDHVAKVAWRGL